MKNLPRIRRRHLVVGMALVLALSLAMPAFGAPSVTSLARKALGSRRAPTSARRRR